MNGHLQHLLSRGFDGALAPEHLADLRKSTITDDTITAQLIRSVPPAMIGPLIGFDLPGVRSALLFPFRSPVAGFMDHVRIKVFPHLTDRAGHKIKYLQPKGTRPRLYFCAGAVAAVLDSTEPLWLVEGEKKALAVAQLGLATVGFCGVEGWHPPGASSLLEDFDAIPLRGRVVELLPDADYQSNANVERAIRHFARALRSHGAKPGVRLLPRELHR